MNSLRTDAPSPIAEWQAPSPEQFCDEILPARQPAVLRGVANEWQLVRAAKLDPERAMALIAANATGAPADVLRAESAEQGQFHYTRDGSLNFIRGRGNIAGLIAALREEQKSDKPCAIAAQGLLAERHVPGFAKVHPMPFAPATAEPRLWVGNAAKVATHNDPTDNVAVVAAGRRRFTLFPPEAEPNLYMGPKHPTPAGTPVSMVHVTAPDLERFPLYAEAVESAQEAELSPGDAIFIPRDWFHHVEALEPFNVLVNYWWSPSREAP